VVDEWLGNLLSAIGNNEAKALLLSAMSDDRIYSGRDLYRLMLEKQGSCVIWRQNPMTAFQYCQHSLAPVSLVVKEMLNNDLSAYGYAKTRYGSEVGDALAGHLLRFSEQYDHITLLQLFGNTNSSSLKTFTKYRNTMPEYRLRAPIRRYNILSALLRMDLPVRETDLAAQLGEDSRVILSHLRALSQRGVISYNVTEVDAPYAFFKISRRERPAPPPHPSFGVLSAQLYEIIKVSTEDLTRDAIYEALIERYREKEKWDKRNLNTTISKILNYFEKLGYVEHVKFKPSLQSEILLSQEQRDLISEIIGILSNFATLDVSFMNKGREQAYRIANSPERFTQLLAKARQMSPNANKERSDEVPYLLLGLLQKYPGSRASALQRTLADEHGAILTVGRIKQVLRVLRARKSVEVSRQGRALRCRAAAHQT
jgi:predicted ArsR family transcriptional regulator